MEDNRIPKIASKSSRNLKASWDERVCHLCDTKKVEDEKNSLRLSNLYPH
jgi:hypothetical protein